VRTAGRGAGSASRFPSEAPRRGSRTSRPIAGSTCSQGDHVRQAISTAIKAGPLPRELERAPRSLRLLSPISDRLSDSLLVANHGTYELPGISQLAVFPVARGRSAVVFGSAGVKSGELTLSLRARDLMPEDAQDLLDRTIERMEARV
jgi:hypothetical protein